MNCVLSVYPVDDCGLLANYLVDTRTSRPSETASSTGTRRCKTEPVTTTNTRRYHYNVPWLLCYVGVNNIGVCEY